MMQLETILNIIFVFLIILLSSTSILSILAIIDNEHLSWYISIILAILANTIFLSIIFIQLIRIEDEPEIPTSIETDD